MFVQAWLRTVLQHFPFAAFTVPVPVGGVSIHTQVHVLLIQPVRYNVPSYHVPVGLHQAGHVYNYSASTSFRGVGRFLQRSYCTSRYSMFLRPAECRIVAQKLDMFLLSPDTARTGIVDSFSNLWTGLYCSTVVQLKNCTKHSASNEYEDSTRIIEYSLLYSSYSCTVLVLYIVRYQNVPQLPVQYNTGTVPLLLYEGTDIN